MGDGTQAPQSDGNRDARYTREGVIELDERYFSVASKEINRGKGTRGRGAEGKQNVAVMAESTPLEDIETGKKEKHVRYFKARVLDSHQSEGINELVRDCMEDEAIVFSDKSTSYVDICDLVELHVTEKSDAKTTREMGTYRYQQCQNGHCWAITIKSKGSTSSSTSMSSFINSIEGISETNYLTDWSLQI
jgi:hypothetical protein